MNVLGGAMSEVTRTKPSSVGDGTSLSCLLHFQLSEGKLDVSLGLRNCYKGINELIT